MAKRLIRCFLLTAVMIMCLMANCLTASAATTYTVPVTVKYGQTEARSMLNMINKFRTGKDAWYWDYGDKEKIYLTDLSKLEYDYGLEQIAMQRAAEIAVSFSHTRPNGSSCFDIAVSSGASSYGENIAAGYGSAASVFEGWQETNYGYSGQGHRRNMLGGYTHVGIGHVVVNGIHYWVQEFGYGSGAAKTSANDSNTTVNIGIDSSMISSLSVTPSSESMKISVGKTAKIPTAKVSFYMEETWGYAIEFGITPDWTASGGAISLSGGNITAKSVGSSTLTATVYGKKVSVAVTVECTDHKWGSWSATKQATCTDKGSETRKCSVCGKSETRSIAAKGHSFGSYSVTKAAACTDKGTETRKCSACGKSETRSIEAKGHSFGKYKTVKKATATQEGLEERSCSVCGKTEQRTIAKLAPVTTSVTTKKPGQSGTISDASETTATTTAPEDESGLPEETTAPDESSLPVGTDDVSVTDDSGEESEEPADDEVSEAPSDGEDVSDASDISLSQDSEADVSSSDESVSDDASQADDTADSASESASASDNADDNDSSALVYGGIAAGAAVIIGGIIVIIIKKKRR